MRFISPLRSAKLIFLALFLASCDPSDAPEFSNALPVPASGTGFMFSSQALDVNGQPVDAPVSFTYKIGTLSQTVGGKTNAYGVTDESTGIQFYLQIGSDGDISLLRDPDDADGPVWSTLPVTTHATTTAAWNERVGSSMRLWRETISYGGKETINAGGTSYETDKVTSSLLEILGSDTTRHTRTFYYARAAKFWVREDVMTVTSTGIATRRQKSLSQIVVRVV